MCRRKGLTLRFKEVFVRLKAEYHDILAHIDELSEAIRQLPADEERRELEAERKALRGLKRLIDKRSLLEHLTNVGLLPNYAFPETGVTLNAWVKAGKAKASEGLPTDQSFEIVRPASSAIRELAPDNHFYSQGYKMAVSGLNTFDWKDPGTLLKKRSVPTATTLMTPSAVRSPFVRSAATPPGPPGRTPTCLCA